MGKPSVVTAQRVQVVHSILEVDPVQWQRLAGPGFPFMDYHFLSALETSGSLGKRTGWEPRILTLRSGPELHGAVISYLKYNSYGEYIFDFAWAEAYQRYGLEYYPKLTSAIPFTPATGPKLLVRADLDEPQRSAVALELLQAMDQAGAQASGLHALFIPQAQIPTYQAAGYFIRHSFQFHWQNNGFKDFTEFLSQMTSKRRREVLRERAQVQEKPIRIVRLTGAQITPELGDVLYQFYLSTIEKRSSYDYFTETFFRTVFETMPDKLMLAIALDADDAPVAGALFYFDAQTLYGRNWGCLEEFRSLHFELCYYQGIEFAIERGLTKFEAGAQGEHKLQRGFLPELTYSAHKIHDPRLGQAIRDHVGFEQAQVADIRAQYLAHSPFRCI